MEYQDAPQNTRELLRNTKKLARILRAFDVKMEKAEGGCQTRPRPGANAVKCHQKGSPRPPKAHQKGTKLLPKRAKIAKMTPDGTSMNFFINI